MKTSINLLPMSIRRQQLVRRRITQWSRVLVALFLCGWIVHWHLLRQQDVMSQRLSVLAREHRPTQTMLQQLIDMREQLADIEQQQIVARELERRRNVLAVLGIVSQTARRTDGRLRVTKLELSDFQNREAAGSAGTAETVGGKVLVEGVSLDNPSVMELLDGLQDSGIFRRVELLAAKEREGDRSAMRDYEMRCDL